MIAKDLQALAVEISELQTLEGNPRRGDVEAVARSLTAFGQRKPIVAKLDGTVIAGNHTFLAAQSLGWSEIAVVRVDDDDTTAKAYALADNRTAELGGYDDVDLAQMMSEVAEADRDLFEATAWKYDELDDLLKQVADSGGEGLTPKDEAPRVTPDPFVQTGDLWILGDHRLVCGDSTSPEVMGLLMDGDTADLVWTDPPYGVAIVGRTKDKLTIKNDEVDGDKLHKLLEAAFGNTFNHTRPGGVWYVAAPSGPFFAVFGVLLSDLGVWRQTIAWVKDTLVLGRADFHGKHESIFYGWSPGDDPVEPPPIDMTDAPPPDEHFTEGYDNILYGWSPGAGHHRPPTRKQDTVWEFPRPKRNPDHPTMKPVGLIERSLRTSSNFGDLVLDPFGGSGSTLIAAHHTKRRGRLIELDPVYAEVICRRFEEHTGVVPVNGLTGEPHSFRRET